MQTNKPCTPSLKNSRDSAGVPEKTNNRRNSHSIRHEGSQSSGNKLLQNSEKRRETKPVLTEERISEEQKQLVKQEP